MPQPRRVGGRLLTDPEIKIWETADRGTNRDGPAFRALLQRFADEDRAELARVAPGRAPNICTECGQRCNKWQRRSFGDPEVRWPSMCCLAPLPPELG